MFGDLGKIMKMAKDMKERMPAMQAELANKEFTAEAGGGMVSATVNGKGQLVDVKISREVVSGGDVEMLEDLVKAAVSSAQDKATQSAAEMMHEITGGMNLPGLDGLLGG
jgi:nucleoid-associated protein EbfC